jgi:hypothetical protein
VTDLNESIETSVATDEHLASLIPPASAPLSLIGVPTEAQGMLMRMFADPRVLAKEEKAELVRRMRECVERNPKVSDLRVLYGMVLSVNLQAQEAMEELGEAVALTPHSFIAHLKMGELWMRLRVCTKAQDHTHQAALLAQNLAQSEMARRQATTLRVMMREGVDRNGYRTPWISLTRLKRLWKRSRSKSDALVAADVG